MWNWGEKPTDCSMRNLPILVGNWGGKLTLAAKSSISYSFFVSAVGRSTTLLFGSPASLDTRSSYRLSGERSPSAWRGCLYGKSWSASEGAEWLMQALKCFLHQGSFYKQLGSRTSLGSWLLTYWRILHYLEFFPPRTPRRCFRGQIPAQSSCLPALCRYCFAPAVTNRKRHRFFISW